MNNNELVAKLCELGREPDITKRTYGFDVLFDAIPSDAPIDLVGADVSGCNFSHLNLFKTTGWDKVSGHEGVIISDDTLLDIGGGRINTLQTNDVTKEQSFTTEFCPYTGPKWLVSLHKMAKENGYAIWKDGEAQRYGDLQPKNKVTGHEKTLQNPLDPMGQSPEDQINFN